MSRIPQASATARNLLVTTPDDTDCAQALLIVAIERSEGEASRCACPHVLGALLAALSHAVAVGTPRAPDPGSTQAESDAHRTSLKIPGSSVDGFDADANDLLPRLQFTDVLGRVGSDAFSRKH